MSIGPHVAPMKIRSDGYDVVASGLVHTFGNEHLELQLADLKFEFRFVNDPKRKNEIERHPVDSKTLKLVLYNYNNVLGTGFNTPVLVGALGNQRLYLALIVYAFDDTSLKTVQYSFFVGGEVSE